MAYFRCGGGGDGKKSLILPENVDVVNVLSGDGKVNLSWETPENSEVPIEYFNVYYCKKDSAPSSLEEFTLHGVASSSDTSYVIDGLENDTDYYVVVESVTTDDYENASMRGVSKGHPCSVELVVCYGGDSVYSTSTEKKFFYTANAEDWETQETDNLFVCIKWVHDRWIALCNVRSHSAYSTSTVSNGTTIVTFYEKMYYSFDRKNWVEFHVPVQTVGLMQNFSVSWSIAPLSDMEYVNGNYIFYLSGTASSTINGNSNSSYQLMIAITSDFETFKVQNVMSATHGSGTYRYLRFFTVGNYLILVEPPCGNVTNSYLQVRKLEDLSTSVSSQMISSSPSTSNQTHITKYDKWAYIMVDNRLYRINGDDFSIVNIKNYSSNAKALFNDGEYVYLCANAGDGYKWYKMEIGSTTILETGVDGPDVSSNYYMVENSNSRWFLSASNIYYSDKNLSTWILAKARESEFYLDWLSAKRGDF